MAKRTMRAATSPKRLHRSRGDDLGMSDTDGEEAAMRHRKAGRKFGRNPAQRRALLRQLAVSMILHERITTTEAKAKTIRPIVEKLVTIAREDSHAHRKLIMSKIDHPLATAKLFEVIAPRFIETPADTPVSRSSSRAAAMPRRWH